jgi:drug/metabolite transporter (DMT)-like permease
VTHIPLANAAMISKTHPLFTAVFSSWFLGEELSRRQLMAIGVALLGVAGMAKPTTAPLLLPHADASEQDSLWWYGGALLSGMGSAAAYTCIRALAHVEEQWLLIAVFPAVSIPLSLLFGWQGFVSPTAPQWAWLLFLSLATQAGQVGLNAGLKALPAARATTLSFSGVIFGALWGVMLGDRIPHGNDFVGLTAIAVALAMQ